MKPGISVVIPVYGDFDIKRTLMSIESIKKQKEVSVEIIVSEQGEKKRFPDIEGVKHIFTYHKPLSKLSDFNPGQVRNIAIANSTKEFVYTNDADIVFLDLYYLKKSMDFLKKNPNRILFRPFMRRLPLDNFETFNSWYDSRGIKKSLQKLIKNQKFLIKTKSKYRKMKIFEKDSKEARYRKTFTSLVEDYHEYVKKGLGSDKNLNFWPVYWNENRHCGANMFRKSHFIRVGGYCEKFINWGCEDSDLQWKFREIYKLEFFPPELEVMHLDHQKEYVSPKMWARNEKICVERRNKEGLAKAIENDRRNKLWLPQ